MESNQRAVSGCELTRPELIT